jgi:ABC-type multidrug transport system fused ATPase/permease subunit
VSLSTELLQMIAGIIVTITGLTMYLLVAINISFTVTALTLGVGVFISLILMPLIAKIKQISRIKTVLNKKIAQHVNESILGMKTVKSMLVENPVAKIGAAYFSQMKALQTRYFVLKTVPTTFIQPMSIVFISFVFLISYRLPNFNFGVLVAIIYLIQRIFDYIQTLQSNLHSINTAIPYLQSVLSCEEKSVQYREKDAGTENFEFNKSLKFKNATFSYRRRKTILSDVSLEIKKGQMVGLIGLSGAGKTTLFDLILRLFKPVSGKILLDGRDISKIKLQEWRKNVGYVSQDLFLINDTIANNIRFYDDTFKGRGYYRSF